MEEGMNKKMNLGVAVPSRASETTTPLQLARLAPSNLPLLPSTGLNQAWNFVNQGGGSRSTGTTRAVNAVTFDQGDKISAQPSDTNIAFNCDLHVTIENGVEAGSKFQMGSNNPDPNVDPRKLRRTISNRLSAQKSRMRKLQHIYDMEKRVKTLEAEIAALSPQVMFQIHQQKLLKMENYFLNHQIVTFAENNMLKMAQLEEHKAEVIRLRQLNMTQQRQKFQGQTTTPGDLGN